MLLLKTWQIHKTSVRSGLKATCCVQLNIVLWDRVNLNFTEIFKSRYPKITAATGKIIIFLSRQISPGIHRINCLLYILKVLLNLHNFPLLNRNCTELYLGPLYRSYILVQILNCKVPERVLLNGAIWKRCSKVSRRWRCAACHLFQVFTYRNHETVLSETTRTKLGTRRLWISFFFFLVNCWT